MGNFFTSPQERKANSMWDAASSGKPLGSQFLEPIYNETVRNIEGQTSQRIAGIGGDILSRSASMGVSPGSNTEAMTTMAKEPLLANEQSAISQAGIAKQQAMVQMLMQQLFAGYSGSSSSSTFGDIMGGLSTAAQIFAGVGTGFPQLFGGAKPPSINVSS